MGDRVGDVIMVHTLCLTRKEFHIPVFCKIETIAAGKASLGKPFMDKQLTVPFEPPLGVLVAVPTLISSENI